MTLRRRHIVLLISLVAIIGALCLLNNRNKLYAFNTVSEWDNLEKTVSIMTFNIAAYDSASFPLSKQDELMELIKHEKPDILCFQEMSFETLGMIKPQLDSIYGPCEVLRGDDQMWRLRFYSHLPLRNFSRHKCEGEFDTSNLTDEETHMIEQSQKQMGMMSAEFEIEPGRWATVFSGHLRSSAYSTARRSMDKDASWFDGLSLYKRNYEVGKRIRDYEAENVRRFIDETRTDPSTDSGTGMPVIVAGDLNDWCGRDCLNTLMGDNLKDAWWEGGNGFGWTYFGWHLRLRLDHILYSDELELVDVKVIDTDISDHKPLMAKFRFRN